MARASKLVVAGFVAAMLAVSLLAVSLRGRLRCAGFAGPGVTAAELPAPAARDELRVASWNLRNFPLDERPQEPDLGYLRRTNICDLETALGGLDADLLALQEVCDTRRLPPILRRACAPRPMRAVFSAAGGRFGQHLALAWDDSVLELVDGPFELTELVLAEGMRPGLAAGFRSRAGGGLELTVVTVHLESGRDGFGARRRQNRALADWLEARGAARGESSFVVLGDLNTAGSPRGGVAGELQSLDAILGRAGLDRLAGAGCSQYWEGGGGRDGVQQPSLLDHVLLGGPALAAAGPVSAWLHCARAGCAELVSRPGQEDGTFWDVSDHCPLTFEIRVGGSG
ncbi:MAG: endonuclease/exonuclease/phosphatase family protein [Thermoanaerobaculales bacterium]|jgi:endonuclease/exonuclease/phosphatase family metal-dependent hydrolase|nr:endonuclease/exonuclease/phosphatase family protein [Thermoanaerobaculales bacterium]